MTLTHFGLREWGLGTAALALFWAAAAALWHYGFPTAAAVVAVAALVCWLPVGFFFRNPKRRLPEDLSLILSPADGVVRDIEVVDFDQEPFNGRALRIGIFLSVLNVHVNRAPAEWKLISKIYREGRYLDARDSRCAKENEAMTLGGNASVCGETFPMAVRQISGAIARRIVCPPDPGCHLARGKVYGMIKFGSRTELYLPDDPRFKVLVKIGDKVNSGIVALARLEKE
ncbi:MAG: phosphatidylserine decarboxylase [Victivallaceae bacterium]|nr:phosphatidylserine decarboxylase [Victivallaceae bacterium]